MRKQYSPAFKTGTVLDIFRGGKTITQIAADKEVAPALAAKWRDSAMAAICNSFERKDKIESEEAENERKVAELYEQIGRLTLQVNWMKKNLASTLTHSERKALIEKDGELTLEMQSELLSISRASLYYKPKEPSSNEIQIKHRLDRLYTDHPFLGSRKIVEILAGEGIIVGRHTVRGYREEMGLVTIFPKPKLSVPGGAGHVLYPYLLRELVIDRPNQVWGVDITYIRMVRGWTYLVAFMDWYSRYVVSWELSSTLEMSFVLNCRDTALTQSVPEIVNSDHTQRVPGHFTSEKFVKKWLESGVQVSMDGRGRCMDNIFTERLWRSVKWEEVYLKEYENASEAYSGLERYFDFYNQVRPHQSLGYATPAQVYAGEVIPEAICISKPVKGAKTVPEIGEAAPGKSVAPSVLFK